MSSAREARVRISVVVSREREGERKSSVSHDERKKAGGKESKHAARKLPTGNS